MIMAIGSQQDTNTTLLFYYFGAVLIGYFVIEFRRILLANQLKNKMAHIVICQIKSHGGETAHILWYSAHAERFWCIA